MRLDRDWKVSKDNSVGHKFIQRVCIQAELSLLETQARSNQLDYYRTGIVLWHTLNKHFYNFEHVWLVNRGRQK